MFDLKNLQPGDTLPALTLPPVSRTTLALFAGASGDHNPLHIDIDAARDAGMPDVFAQGMLPMAWLARALTDTIPQRRLRSFGVRFAAVTHLRAVLTCTARMTEVFEAEGERRASLSLTVADQDGQTKLSGQAVVALA